MNNNFKNDIFNTIQKLDNHTKTFYYSLPELEKKTNLPIHRIPISLRIVLEAVLRNIDGKKITKETVLSLASWSPKQPKEEEIPFIVSRVILQDFTGVPLLVDLSA